MKNFLSHIAILFFVLSLFSCKTESGYSKEELQKSIQDLKSKEDKRAFLEKIYFDYQLIMAEEEKIHKIYGPNSKEFADYRVEKSESEDRYLEMISIYFEEYGYPNRTELGQYASIVPLIVYFYATKLKGFRKDHFKYFYGAYKFKDIPESHFLAYMQSFYEAHNGKKFIVSEKDTTPEREIYAIMDAMNYEY